MKKLKTLRRVLCSFLAAAMMISAVGCNLNTKPQNNNSSLNTARKITNYFRSTDFQCPEEISDISNMQCINDKMYISGYASASNANHYLTVFDTATGQKADIDVSDIDIAYFQNVYLSQEIAYIEYSDSSEKNMTHICALNRSTGEKISDVELGADTYTTGLYSNKDGDLCSVATTYSPTSQESMLIIYDKNTLEVKEKTNVSEKIQLPQNQMIVLLLPQADGSSYAFAVDMSAMGNHEEVSIYKLSPSYEVTYKIEDAFGDMGGDFNGAYVAKNGNLCVMTYDYESDSNIYNTNELDSTTGEVVGRYEPELEDADILPFVTMEGYDFVFIKEGKLFGYNVEDNTEKEIVDYVKQVGEEYENCYSVSMCGSSILLAAESYENGSSESLFEMDKDGNILNKIALPENSQSYNMQVSKDGLIHLICCDYSQNDGAQSYEICTIDNQGNEKNRVSLNPEQSDGNDSYLNNFLLNGNGDICASYQIYDKNNGGGSNKNIVVVFDSDGNEKFRIEDDSINYVEGMMSCESGDYIYYYSKTGFELSRIDYEKKNIGEKIEIDVNFNRIYPGDDKFDFYYNDGEGMYGYNIKDKKATEIINWIDSDIDLEIDNACVISSDKIMIRSYDRETGRPSVCQLDRVSDEDLKLIQNKKIITLAGVGITYGETKDAVVKFNKENDKYRIQVNDYDKYSSYEDDNYLSGTNRLNTDLASGSLPDILVGNYEVDMPSYISKGLLTDLNPFIEKDKDISREDYFENIFDIYSTDGKLYQLVTDFNITTLVGKQSDLGDKSGWTFDDFFKFAEGKNVFYNIEREEMLNSILNNLSEYVDFKKKTCDFNNDNFIKLLEFIKENGLTEEEAENQSYYGKDEFDEDKYKEYLGRFENKKCYLENTSISTFDEIANLQQYILNDSVSFIGLPSSSAESNGALISADSTIGISDKSEVKDGAWDFVRGFMLEDYQKGLNEQYSHTFPIMKSAFNDLATKSQSSVEPRQDQNYKGESTKLNPLDSKSIEKFTKLVENTSRAAVSDSKINKIINEQVKTFFEDGQSAKEAAEAIQSKASLYLKEIK